MQRYQLLEFRYNVRLAKKRLENDVFLSINRKQGHATISYCDRITPEQALLLVGIMYGVLELGWEGFRFGLRLPLQTDRQEVKNGHARDRRDFRRPIKWACEYLLPDRLLDQANREGMDIPQMCEEFGLPAEVCERGVEEHIARRAGLVRFG